LVVFVDHLDGGLAEDDEVYLVFGFGDLFALQEDGVEV
jgi:hypothetical protein